MAGQAGVNLGLSLPEAAVSGAISIELNGGFLTEQVMRVQLGGVQAYFEIDVAASAGIYESIELAASETLALSIPGVVAIRVSVLRFT